MTDEYAPKRFCSLPKVTPVPLPPTLGTPRVQAIRLVKNKWLKGTTLTYFFKTIGPFGWPEEQKTVVREAFAKWKAVGISLSFKEVHRERDATLIIGMMLDDGSWSYVGTDVVSNRRRGCNMNFGWDLTTDWGHATALHEIGHALGMPHEHQNPKSGIRWNETAVIAEFSASPNDWKESDIRFNILRQLDMAEVEGSEWDPNSIMHYPFKPGMIIAPPPFDTKGTPENLELNANDRAWMARFYSPARPAAPLSTGQLAAISPEVSAQTDFVIEPQQTRAYRFQAVGEADVKLAILEEDGDDPTLTLAVADDSGLSANAAVTHVLEAGKRYRLCARTHFAAQDGGAHVVVV
ncbi:MAG: M12 family metallopeptidase [Novosphingobium sp.]